VNGQHEFLSKEAISADDPVDNTYVGQLAVDKKKNHSDSETLTATNTESVRVALSKLFEVDESPKSIPAESRRKQTLYDILCDRDDDDNMDAVLIQKVLCSLSEMATLSNHSSLTTFCQISSQTQMQIVDKLLQIIELQDDSRCYAVDVILQYLSTDLITDQLDSGYLESVSQHLMTWINFKISPLSDSHSHSALNVLSAIKALIRCVQILEDESTPNPDRDITAYIECIGVSVLDTMRRIETLPRPELSWSVMQDVEAMITGFPRICIHWKWEPFISTFGVVFSDCPFIKRQKVRILCSLITALRLDADHRDRCDAVISELDCYLNDEVDAQIIECIVVHCRSVIRSLIQSESELQRDTLSTINGLFGMLTANTLDAMAHSAELFVHKLAVSAPIIQSILTMFRRSELQRADKVDIERYPFLHCKYHCHLVQCLIAFYLNNMGTLPMDNRMVNAVVVLTGEYGECLEEEPLFNVFNSLLTTFYDEAQCVQLSVLTAITKVYCKSNVESRAKLKALFEHILDLALCPKDDAFISLDVRCRALMYRRLVGHDVDGAQRIVMGIGVTSKRVNAVDTVRRKEDHEREFNGNGGRNEDRFENVEYSQIDSDPDTEDQSEYEDDSDHDSEHSEDSTECASDSDDDSESEISEDDKLQQNRRRRLLVDAQRGKGLEIELEMESVSSHKVTLRMTNTTKFDIYQIDLKFNKNYLGAQSLKTLLGDGVILKSASSMSVAVSLKLTESAYSEMELKDSGMEIETAIRFFQQCARKSGDGETRLMSRSSSTIFFLCPVTPWIVFNSSSFNDLAHYAQNAQSLSAISRKCTLDIAVRDDGDTERIIDDCFVERLKCKKMKELRLEKEIKIIYQALLSFKWTLIGVCIRDNEQEDGQRVTVDIIAKASSRWIAEVAMQSCKLAIMSDGHFAICQ